MVDVYNKRKLTLSRTVSAADAPNYPADKWLHDPDLAAVDGVAAEHWKLDGEDVIEMTQAEKDALTAAELTAEKARRVDEINDRTDDLESQGFVHDGKLFALDSGARENWSALAEADDKGLLTFPQSVGTKDFDDYEIADSAALTSFYASGLGTAKFHREGGQVFRKAIRDATTRAAVDAVVDAR